MPNHVLITLFNSENYGYGGSQRFVEDLIKDSYQDESFRQIKFDAIKGVIDFDSIGLVNTNNGPSNYYLHRDKTDISNMLVSKLSGTFSGLFPLNVNSTSDPSLGLPPSSLHSFLRKNRSIPGVVVSDYDTKFSNEFFNSELDNGIEWTQSNVDSICSLSTFFAQKIYSLAGETDTIPPEIQANCSFVTFSRN